MVASVESTLFMFPVSMVCYGTQFSAPVSPSLHAGFGGDREKQGERP